MAKVALNEMSIPVNGVIYNSLINHRDGLAHDVVKYVSALYEAVGVPNCKLIPAMNPVLDAIAQDQWVLPTDVTYYAQGEKFQRIELNILVGETNILYVNLCPTYMVISVGTVDSTSDLEELVELPEPKDKVLVGQVFYAHEKTRKILGLPPLPDLQDWTQVIHTLCQEYLLLIGGLNVSRLPPAN